MQEQLFTAKDMVVSWIYCSRHYYYAQVPPLILWTYLPSVCSSLVYIDTPGRTCLDELFIEYEQVTTWEARFSSNKLEASYYILSAAVCTGRLNGQAHKSPPLQFG